MKKSYKNIISNFAKFVLICAAANIQQESFAKPKKVECDIYPSIGKSIMGIDEFERKKFVNIAANSREVIGAIGGDEKLFDYYFNTLQMNLGRRLSLVSEQVFWAKTVREDPARAGYADIDFLKSKASPSDAKMDALKSILGERDGVACHGAPNAYPKFFKLYTLDNGETYFPESGDAAAELVSNILKYAYTDFQRPEFFEPINEPHWRYIKDPRFIGYHVDIKRAVEKFKIGVKVGGPCNSVSYYHKNKYASTNSILGFIDATNNELDFYSFHSYDYMRFDEETRNFVGSVTSGLPLEGVFDAISSHVFNKYGKNWSYVASEHGAYVPDRQNFEAARDALVKNPENKTPDFEHEMKRRGIEDFILVNGAIANTMVFMNHPHIVLKAVPFILLESAGWDPKYYSSLLVKRNFDKSNPEWVESSLIYFYKFFQDVRGKMIHSHSNDLDIQQHGFVDGSKIFLLFHNLSDAKKSLSLNLKDFGGNIDSIKIRRLYRSEKNFTPKFTEKNAGSFAEISMKPQESMVVILTCSEKIEFNKKYDTKIFYATQQCKSFKGESAFTVKMPQGLRVKDAFLRVGLDSPENFDNLKISLNGEPLAFDSEESAPRYTYEEGHASTKIIRVAPEKLKSENEVKVDFGKNVEGGVGGVVLRAMCE